MKISVIMQSYLGNYPGSRSNPEEKFHRAVKSFLNQTYSEKELVIVSDGCPKTMKIFYENYALYDNIKFLYLHNSKERMYSLENGNTLYRGKPKAMGVEFATGDIITYMDSDDIILPKRLEDLYLNWKDKDDNILWSNNPMRYMNSKHVRNVNKYHLTLEDRTSFFL